MTDELTKKARAVADAWEAQYDGRTEHYEAVAPLIEDFIALLRRTSEGAMEGATEAESQ